jgi:hypothetical protein
MWFKVEQKRFSIGQKYLVRCNSEMGGSRVVEERPVKGVVAARKTAEMLATSLNVRHRFRRRIRLRSSRGCQRGG